MSDFESKLHVRSDDETAFRATVIGAGTAGSPDAGVVTIQGITGAEPVPVVITNPDDADVNGLPVGTARKADVDSEAAVASGADSGALATVAITAGKQGYVRGFKASGSGLAKFQLLVGADFASALPVAIPQFTNPANLNADCVFATPIPVAGGESVFVKGTNRDKLAQDLYASIDAYETV